MADLSVEVAGIRFANPVMPAAGPPVRTGQAMLRCAAGGAGGLVSKTISTRAATPPTPNIAEIPHGLVNTELWSELPPEQWIDHEYSVAREAGLPLIVSLGYSAFDIAWLAPRIRPFADAVELSTHYIGEDASPMVAAIRAAKAALDVPVFVKLSPLGREMVRAAEQAEAAGADGIVAINSFGPVLAIDPDTRQPYLGGTDGYGWLSGPALKPLALRCVRDIARAVRVPVIGVGGIGRGSDVVEMLIAGASAVQVCTAAILHGPGVFGKIAHELDTWLDEHGYATAAELRGLAVQGMSTAWAEGEPVVAAAACNGCALCAVSCPYDAITVVDKLAIIDLEACARCGLCVTRCRRGAIEWVPAVPVG
ncbi:MAG TPA: 4Fe-4S binding protein [Candidatus Limnocylindrales bacterium]|nr:4Fe-4S binding protein [Candidatus Limnocylindrales bacterium]